MGVDTYLLVPTSTPERARRDFEEDELVKVGADYIVLYQGERFAEVKRDPEAWGVEYHRMLPAWLRRGIDARGIVAVPEAGAVPDEARYADALRASPHALFLPVKRSRAKKRLRVLLVALSAQRERALRAEPDLVRRLVAAVAVQKRGVPESIELDDAWVALAPRGGLPLYDDQTVESSRILPAERVRALSAWLTSLPEDAAAELERVKRFYDAAAGLGRALLVVRYRA